MPRQKSLKTLFLETVMFISLFALMGHLSVNFWERYVIQSELSKMKTSLHSLKDTINNIGIAYDHLHKELKDLAEIAEKQSTSPADIPHCKSQSSLTKQLIQDIHVQAAIATNEMDINAIPMTDEKNTQKCLHKQRHGKNAATYTKPDNIQKEGKNVGPEIVYLNDKMVQNTIVHPENHANVFQDLKPLKVKNATTITRYPLKSSAAGTEKSSFTYESNHDRYIGTNNKYARSQIHKCHEDGSTDDENYFWKF